MDTSKPCTCEVYRFPHRRGRECERLERERQEQMDWPDDYKLDSPIRGQAEGINRERNK